MEKHSIKIKQQKLAKALRQNLLKRKQQQRARNKAIDDNKNP